MKLQRYSGNPILTPNPDNDWEALNVFNGGVVFSDGLFVMLYRAQGLDYVSTIGGAVSVDGVHFNRFQEPVLSPHDEWDAMGLEDPRITYLADEGRYIMAYTAYSPKGITPMFAESKNLYEWKQIGSLVKGEDNKDHVLFPRRISGRYVSFHRRPPGIWLAYSDDLHTWTDFEPLMAPRPELWDNNRIGAGGVPIETDQGWLCIYHSYDHQKVYRLGTCLLDLDDPSRVISRPKDFILEPEEPWELEGDVPNVVFSTANPVVNGKVYVYYGGADRVIGLAICSLADLLEFTVHG
jgi:predicted GH43/DUF377 family glycosyl hydrolase